MYLGIKQKMGALGIHSHDRLFGGTKKDRVLAREAELKHAKELEEEPPEPAAFTAHSTAPGNAPLAAASAKHSKRYAGAIARHLAPVGCCILIARAICQLFQCLNDCMQATVAGAPLQEGCDPNIVFVLDVGWAITEL